MQSLNKLFKRDLEKLSFEIRSFTKPENMWKVKDGVSNSSGNLCLHLLGNLNHFVGAIIGNSGYVRQREKEFSTLGVTKEEMLNQIKETQVVVVSSLEKFDMKYAHSMYPINVFGEEMTYEYFLIHLHSHLNYHLGQINYLRRMLEK